MARTILLADDSLTIRKVVELTFSDTDIRVDAVGSGREALERLAVSRPDLVLADVVMPGPSGYEVCRAVKRSARPVPVLLLAGTFESFDPAEARACGADGHMTKPFDSRTLVERVLGLLAPQTPGAVAEPKPTYVAPPPREPDADLEAMFDDLAAPADAAALDAPPGPAPAAAAVSPAGAEAREPADARAVPAPAAGLTPAEIDAIARAVVERLSDGVLREIAWDVVPDLAEVIVRERLRELEREP